MGSCDSPPWKGSDGAWAACPAPRWRCAGLAACEAPAAATAAGAASPVTTGGGVAWAKSPCGCSVSRSTGRTERKSKRNESAELAPTPRRTFLQSSPDVLSTTAHPARSTFSWSPSMTR